MTLKSSDLNSLQSWRDTHSLTTCGTSPVDCPRYDRLTIFESELTSSSHLTRLLFADFLFPGRTPVFSRCFDLRFGSFFMFTLFLFHRLLGSVTSLSPSLVGTFFFCSHLDPFPYINFSRSSLSVSPCATLSYTLQASFTIPLILSFSTQIRWVTASF